MVATDAADSEGAGVEPVVSPDARRFLDESCGKCGAIKINQPPESKASLGRREKIL